MSVRAIDNAAGSPASMPAATSPTTPKATGTRVETRRELGAVGGGARLLAVDAGHGRDPRRASLGRRALPGYPDVSANDRHDEGDRRGRDHRHRRPVAHRHVGRCESDPRTERRQGHEGEPLEPSVPEPHLAAPGGDPEEEQPAGGPLEENRGRGEIEHEPRLTVRPPRPAWRPVGRRSWVDRPISNDSACLVLNAPPDPSIHGGRHPRTQVSPCAAS